MRVPAVALAAGLAALGCGRMGKPVVPEAPPTAEQMAEFWTDPGDIPARDLFHGPGGPALMPPDGAAFRFVERDLTGYSRGYDVTDANGMTWSVKYGPEAQSEVVTSRIVWALGYRQPPTYYVARWRLEGGDPARDLAYPGRFRPRLPGWTKAGEWSWRRNPFVGSQPYKGLLVLMRVVNNWDLLDRNNALYTLEPPVEGARRFFVVQDLGAALGKTRLAPDSGTRNDLEDFLEQGFIEGVSPGGEVTFDEKGKFHRALFEGITTADVRWTCERLERITDAQWADAFRAAGYEPATAAAFIRRIEEKIAAGLALRP